MACPECGREQVVFAVPADLREYLPEATERAAICTRCLALDPATDAPAGATDFDAIGDEFPDGSAGVAMALAAGLLDSLALYREEIAALLERVEREGSDPLLVLDRLAADPGVEPHFETARRRTQLEQLLYQ
ncbi:hypothetical protein BRC82_00860 [Halobacteriales archaeon QS_1_67_19]|nr:MAG: hypothetical protein BRC82_00860 [Halobacteriales archaeon QS_1_67_19]